jgi:hypothetical protein
MRSSSWLIVFGFNFGLPASSRFREGEMRFEFGFIGSGAVITRGTERGAGMSGSLAPFCSDINRSKYSEEVVDIEVRL